MKRHIVLIVDDQEDVLRVLSELLECYDYQTLLAKNVSEAFDRLKEKQVDLIISDLEMPEEDGMSFYRKLNTTGKLIPFVFFSGRPEKIEKNIPAFKKPIELENLINFIKKILPSG